MLCCITGFHLGFKENIPLIDLFHRPKKEKRLTNIIAELRNSKKHLRSKSEEHQSSEEMSFTEHEGSIRDRESPSKS